MGTAKKGSHSAVTTRTVLSFVRPAGVQKTLKTVREASSSSNVDQEAMHGDGSTAPICVVNGEGNVEWAFSIALYEYDSAIVAVAGAAGIPIKGESGLLFNIIRTSVVEGLTKSKTEILMCSIGDDEEAPDAAGTMRALSGLAQNERKNGVLQLQEAV